MTQIHNRSGSCKTAIFSSKLYRSSTRKDKIKSALENPINAELVKQLDEYIGDEYKPQNKKPEDENFEFQNIDNEVDDKSSSSTESEEAKFSKRHGNILNKEESISDDVQISETNESDDNDDPANASTKSTKPYISADTAVTKPFVETHVALNGLAGEIKGTLNARGNTQGVVRVAVKHDEMWIYYNDDTNLNNIMSPVIELLNAANYHYLIFNRLARTDNAIVFTINGNDSLNNMESVNNEA